MASYKFTEVVFYAQSFLVSNTVLHGHVLEPRLIEVLIATLQAYK